MKLDSIISFGKLAVGAVAASGVSTVVATGVKKLIEPEMKPVRKVMLTIGASAAAGIGSSLAFDYIGKKFDNALDGIKEAKGLVQNVKEGVEEGIQHAQDKKIKETYDKIVEDETKGK